jgi:orotate phosphoribosyltransferase
MERTELLEECRGYIDRHCIFRSPAKAQLLVSKEGGLNAWQFYLPVATLNQGFALTISQLFWDEFRERFEQQPFQLCGCEAGGVGVVTALMSWAHHEGFFVNAFVAKKQAKTYGLKNWLEGVVLPDLPVLLVDDVVASGRTLAAHAARLAGFGLNLCPTAFAIVACKKIKTKEVKVEVLFGPDEFCFTEQAHFEKYGKPSEFLGSRL